MQPPDNIPRSLHDIWYAGRDAGVAGALIIAKQATNGWACYAKRQIEHDEIARLHAAISCLESGRSLGHDDKCESELTSHGYTPCRCHARAGICYCRKNPCECLP